MGANVEARWQCLGWVQALRLMNGCGWRLEQKSGARGRLEWWLVPPVKKGRNWRWRVRLVRGLWIQRTEQEPL